MTNRVVLIGHPVAHSFSAAMQQAAFDALEIDARYELWDRRPMDLAAAIAELRGEAFLGANITIPHKEHTVPLMDRLTEEAQATGAVNVISRDGKKLVGHNTDVAGFKVALDKVVGRQKMPRHAVILGAGGAARAVVYALITEGFQRIVIFNRHLHRGEGLVRHFNRSAAHMDLRAMPWHESVLEAELSKTKLVVNATAVGHVAGETPIPAELLPPDLMVIDLIYNPPQTQLLKDALAARDAVLGGELMLLQQGARAFELWTGKAAPIEVMQAELERVREHGLQQVPIDMGPNGNGTTGVDLPSSETSAPGAASKTDVSRLRFLTAGESHGPALAATLEGVPAGLALTAEAIGVDLARRQRGYGRGARSTSIEHDRAEILAGVRHGMTLGSPILLLIRNRDWENWTRVMQVEALTDEQAAELAALAAGGDRKAAPVTRLRAGHADLAGAVKYGFDDVRNVLERASARETAARVAAGAVARAFLSQLGIDVWSHTTAIGSAASGRALDTRSRDEAEASPLRCLDAAAEQSMIEEIDRARSSGDTVGGVFEVAATGVPIGLGSYVAWDRRLDAALAAAVMSIPIVKGVEFGLGFEQTRRFGSQVMDVIEGRDGAEWRRASNNAGGLEGGMSNGQPIVIRGAVKPISTLPRPLPSADLLTGRPVEKAHYERSDISVVPATGVVAEAMVCLTLADFVLDKFGGDSMLDVLSAAERYRARVALGPVGGSAGAARLAPSDAAIPAESE